jgi:hypothetical protein
MPVQNIRFDFRYLLSEQVNSQPIGNQRPPIGSPKSMNFDSRDAGWTIIQSVNIMAPICEKSHPSFGMDIATCAVCEVQDPHYASSTNKGFFVKKLFQLPTDAAYRDRQSLRDGST